MLLMAHGLLHKTWSVHRTDKHILSALYSTLVVEEKARTSGPLLFRVSKLWSARCRVLGRGYKGRRAKDTEPRETAVETLEGPHKNP